MDRVFIEKFKTHMNEIVEAGDSSEQEYKLKLLGTFLGTMNLNILNELNDYSEWTEYDTDLLIYYVHHISGDNRALVKFKDKVHKLFSCINTYSRSTKIQLTINDNSQALLTGDKKTEYLCNHHTLITAMKIEDSNKLASPLIEHFKKLEKNPDLISEIGEFSDGYHTFNELYEFRKVYNACLFNLANSHSTFSVCKSWKHSDGELCFGGGWFVVSAQTEFGQITNHYEKKDWDLFKCPKVETAPEWDGHTPQEALERLLKLAAAL